MINRYLVIVTLVVWCAPLQRLTADVVFTRRGPVYGRFVSKTESHVLFRERTPEGQYRDLSLPIADVTAMVVNIEERRLESLGPSHPRHYREYAEELAIQKKDPEARALAMRLYLLAAFYGRDELREHALRGMLSVAESANQQRRIRALAKLVLPASAQEHFDEREQGPQQPQEAEESVRTLLNAVRQIRSEQPVLAAESIDTDGCRAVMQRHRHICHWEDLLDWSIHGNLHQGDLARLLRLEIALMKELRSGVEPPGRLKWSGELQAEEAPVLPVSFHTITEFDPAACVFDRGQWNTEQPKSP